MRIDSIVIMNLQAPKQRFIGRLLEIQTSGITVRGMDLEAFEDWIREIEANAEAGVQPATTFFPLHRVEKMILDDNTGALPSLSQMFLKRVGSPIEAYLE